MKDISQEVVSINIPCRKETIAPPAIAVDNNPDAFVVCSPKPKTDKEKITANIIELHKPTPIIVHIEK